MTGSLAIDLDPVTGQAGVSFSLVATSGNGAVLRAETDQQSDLTPLFQGVAGPFDLAWVVEDAGTIPGIEVLLGRSLSPVLAPIFTPTLDPFVGPTGWDITGQTALVTEAPDLFDVVGADGGFQIDDVPSNAGEIVVEALLDTGSALGGRSLPAVPAPNAVTDVGTIVLRPLPELLVATGNPEQLVVFDSASQEFGESLAEALSVPPPSFAGFTAAFSMPGATIVAQTLSLVTLPGTFDFELTCTILEIDPVTQTTVELWSQTELNPDFPSFFTNSSAERCALGLTSPFDGERVIVRERDTGGLAFFELATGSVLPDPILTPDPSTEAVLNLVVKAFPGPAGSILAQLQRVEFDPLSPFVNEQTCTLVSVDPAGEVTEIFSETEQSPPRGLQTPSTCPNQFDAPFDEGSLITRSRDGSIALFDLLSETFGPPFFELTASPGPSLALILTTTLPGPGGTIVAQFAQADTSPGSVEGTCETVRVHPQSGETFPLLSQPLRPPTNLSTICGSTLLWVLDDSGAIENEGNLPEPGGIMLFAWGAGLICWLARRRRRDND